MRLFTAIDISTEVRDNLRALLNRLRPAADLKWSPVENLHITTKFIGEWPETRLEEMKRTLASVSSSVPSPGPFEIAIRTLGWFPNAKRPRVFWAGVEAADSLGILARATDLATAKIGVPAETRPYSPHLTLARIKDNAKLDALFAAVAARASEDFGSFRATSHFLFLSAGGKYTKLSEFPL